MKTRLCGKSIQAQGTGLSPEAEKCLQILGNVRKKCGWSTESKTMSFRRCDKKGRQEPNHLRSWRLWKEFSSLTVNGTLTSSTHSWENLEKEKKKEVQLCRACWGGSYCHSLLRICMKCLQNAYFVSVTSIFNKSSCKPVYKTIFLRLH